MSLPKEFMVMRVMDEVKGQLRPLDDEGATVCISEDKKKAMLNRLQQLAEDASVPFKFAHDGFIINATEVLKWIRRNPAGRSVTVWKPDHPLQSFDGGPEEQADEFLLFFKPEADVWVVQYTKFSHISLGLQSDEDVAGFLSKCKVRSPIQQFDDNDEDEEQFDLQDVYNMQIHA